MCLRVEFGQNRGNSVFLIWYSTYQPLDTLYITSHIHPINIHIQRYYMQWVFYPCILPKDTLGCRLEEPLNLEQIQIKIPIKPN